VPESKVSTANALVAAARELSDAVDKLDFAHPFRTSTTRSHMLGRRTSCTCAVLAPGASA
jgi:hypothetical protein